MSVNTKMTALADEIRELSGTTTSKSIDAMTSDVDIANTEITQQANLIAQISEALEGKASESGGGTNSTSGVFDILDLPVGSVIGSNCKLYFPYAETNPNDIFYNSACVFEMNPLLIFSDGTKIFGMNGTGFYLWWDDMEHLLCDAQGDGRIWTEAAENASNATNSYITLTEGITVIANYAADHNLVKSGRFMLSNATVFSDKGADNSKLVSLAEGDREVYLTTLDLQGCTKIGASAFQNKSIAAVGFPNTVTSIGSNAFEETPLTLVIIPESVTSMGSKAFNNISTWPIVIMLGTTPPSISADTFGDIVEDSSYVTKIYVPAGYGDVYRTASNWSLYTNYIEEF